MQSKPNLFATAAFSAIFAALLSSMKSVTLATSPRSTDTDAGGGETADDVADGGDDANVTDFIDTNDEDTDAGGGTGANDDSDDSDDIEYENTDALNSSLMAVAGFSVSFSSVS